MNSKLLAQSLFAPLEDPIANSSRIAPAPPYIIQHPSLILFSLAKLLLAVSGPILIISTLVVLIHRSLQTHHWLTVFIATFLTLATISFLILSVLLGMF